MSEAVLIGGGGVSRRAVEDGEARPWQSVRETVAWGGGGGQRRTRPYAPLFGNVSAGEMAHAFGWPILKLKLDSLQACSSS